MVTRVTSYIGSTPVSGFTVYPDPQAWRDAAPANLTTAGTDGLGVIWHGKVQKQKFSSGVTFGTDKTVSPTCYFDLETDTNASVFDSTANPLHIDSTKGAVFEVTGESSVIYVQVPYTRVNGIQISATSQNTNMVPAVRVSATGCDFGRLIIDSYGSYPGLHGVYYDGAGGNTLHDILAIQRKPSAGANIINTGANTKLRNITAVSLGATLTNGISTSGAASELTNVYVGGCAAPVNAVNVPNTVTNCATDAASGSAGFTFNVPMSTANFVNVGATTYDFRRVAGSTLDTAGIGAPYTAPAAAAPVAPVLAGPAASATGPTTASGSVGTDKGGGTLYYLLNANATATATEVKAGSSQAVVATGTQTVSWTGLTQATDYYAHFVQVDSNALTSNVVNSAKITTFAVDAVAPVFANGAAITPGTITSSSVAFSYPAATDNVAVTGYQTSKDGGANWQDNGTGLSGQFSGLPADTDTLIAVRAYDAQNNKATPLTRTIRTAAAPAATTGSFKTKPLANNTGTLYAQGTAVAWQWHVAGRIGTAASSIAYGAGSIAADGTLSVAGLPLGSGYLLAAILGANLAADKPYYQSGTVA